MARITTFVKTIRNNWKKSVFGVAAVSYGFNYANEKYRINRLMRNYCADASIYGDKTQPAHQPFPKIIVILNPVADKKSSSDTFEQYCAPILNVGGLSIDIVKTDSEGHARRYVEELDVLPHSILCGGGDGTLAEIVTGLFRRPKYHEEVHPTIGILPIGRENTFGERLFNFINSSELERVKGLADASLAIVRGTTRPTDVMKIEVIECDTENTKAVYGLSGFEWSSFIDAFYQRDKYWYYGRWCDYVTFIFNAFSDSITWDCAATIIYTDPCAGCSNCYIAAQQIETKSSTNRRRWWSSFIPSFRLGSSTQSQVGGKLPDYSKVKNVNCTNQTTIESDGCAGIIVNTSNPHKSNEHGQQYPQLELKVIKGESGFSFINDSWKRLNTNQIDFDQELAVRTVEIRPKIELKPEQEKFFFIDHESYEVKPIRITILPKLVNFYSIEIPNENNEIK